MGTCLITRKGNTNAPKLTKIQSEQMTTSSSASYHSIIASKDYKDCLIVTAGLESYNVTLANGSGTVTKIDTWYTGNTSSNCSACGIWRGQNITKGTEIRHNRHSGAANSYHSYITIIEIS